MRLASMLAAVALLGLCSFGMSTASAHTVTQRTTCTVPTNTTFGKLILGQVPPTAVAQFDMSGRELDAWIDKTIDVVRRINEAEANGTVPEITADDGKCGIVDFRLLMDSGLDADILRKSDTWTKATIAAAFLCSQHEVDGFDAPVAIISTPHYNSTTHHTAYTTMDGLAGSCLACPLTDF